ncbi:uncharacterized protein LOC120213665 [Hibiscus syriacus]|uniref:uncharacterized protein LOC120213665 n=1 Tax=Hibiscus syriacus TaxID=106335 RepID=UPI0019250A52|nr:uncharacterized protein LOC120213665 [Hibiscus syriacus]
MPMILPLQGEKASMKMEASQYKRMEEEKISHTEESLAIFEELMYRKEMEIFSLEFQIEAYKYKLLSLGCGELDDIEKIFRRIDLQNEMMQHKEKERFIPLLEDSAPCRHFYRRISLKILNEKVKEISDCKEVSTKKLPKIKVKPESQCTSPRAKLPPKCQKLKTSEDPSEKVTPSSANSAKSVHDVFIVHCKFKVLESSERKKSNEQKNEGKLYVEEDNRLKKPDIS